MLTLCATCKLKGTASLLDAFSLRHSISDQCKQTTKHHTGSIEKNRRDWVLKTKRLPTFFTFWFLSLRWKNVFCKRLQSLLPLIVEPQVHFTPRFIFQKPLIFKIPLAVFLPQVVGHFCKRLGLNTRYFKIKDLRVTFPRVPVWLGLPTKPNHPVEEGAEQIPPGALAGTSTTKQYNATQRCQCQSRSHVASESRALYLSSWAMLTG